MATLSKTPYKGDWTIDWSDPNLDFRKQMAKQDKQLDAIPVNKLIQFPVADGYAYYYIKQLDPTVILQHIPHGDAYRVNPALIRGLRKSDILRDIKFRKEMKKLFAKQRKDNER